tara:strand:+ start:100536 stop:101021 length:486 start_codon:yes stop_codon:yes gene_type:complete
MFAYLRFLFTSTNQHGIHSPFVYEYVTKCLYNKQQLKLPVSFKVLVKTLNYFKYHTIQFIGDDKTSEEIIKLHCPNILIIEGSADVLAGEIIDLDNQKLIIENLANNSMLFMIGIHKNINNLEQWKKVKTMEHVRVTIDLFYCGLVFFRKEQAKEHFKIRI